MAIRDLVIAGWTGRETAAVEKHIAELEAIGVPRPKSIPCFYRAGANLLTTAGSIQVVGENTSGEVEVVVLAFADGLWISTGSDHTDRKVESYSVAVSKQACPKPVAPVLWRLEDVAPHWDELVLRSWAVSGNERRLYQEGSVRVMRRPEDLIQKYGSLSPGTAMFCGTLPLHGSLDYARRFELELEDPVLNRRIRHGYDVEPLPVIE